MFVLVREPMTKKERCRALCPKIHEISEARTAERIQGRAST